MYLFHLKQENKMGKTQKIGGLGEDLAARFLVRRGYKIVHRNYLKPWGELDIVAEKKGKIHFVEVKSISQRVSDETGKSVTDSFRPEDNVSRGKMSRLSRIIQTYLSAEHVSSETKWQIDVITVSIDVVSKKAKINFLEDVIF